ncbi:hypothetical protein TNCV_4125821 [Trichonephila clavipes]|nr:hypothetical protein TNCV_4125821 [Trichonephila clavipes]
MSKSFSFSFNSTGAAREDQLNSYPATKAELIFRIRRCLRKESEATILKLREHVQAEMFYVNLEHPDMDLSV